MVQHKRRSKRKRQTLADERRRYLLWSIGIPLLLTFLFTVWHYRKGINYYLKTFFAVVNVDGKEYSKYDARNISLMSLHSERIFGIDISEYQGNIIWDSVSLIHEQFPVDFVFIRASMGTRGKDKKFASNWKGVQRISRLRGAYHYFRPNENSIKQAENFIKVVKLKPGDLPPVLDIEERPRSQSMDSLKVGLKRWLRRVEQHYKVKPIVYSGDSYFTDFLENEFSDYTLWIANYNFWIEKPKAHWNFWQFSEKGRVKGIKGFVDLNMFNDDIESLERLCMPFGREF
ncbi:glycoside hydrolase family 25 protein [Sphingobacterium sp. SGG-5]|uniref:glycoside hydrolase family 25 protein n=1 Tax=Sphingobacterium sp. SGG-5 TaxID=2710881 RepID=UPI0013EC25FE|nr:glycoside hydrolase family 25 protein [Sphingobacterium sp. SGG-5]NGM61633.1 glycoside hydrolase family 25 protein [Sphingobacterium sp. SGG-5]